MLEHTAQEQRNLFFINRSINIEKNAGLRWSVSHDHPYITLLISTPLTLLTYTSTPTVPISIPLRVI